MSALADGCARHTRPSKLTAPRESSRVRKADGARRLVVAATHCSSRGVAYREQIATLADNVKRIACARTWRSRPVTPGFRVDDLGAFYIGRWLEFISTVDTASATLGFATCRVAADGVLRARDAATWARDT